MSDAGAVQLDGVDTEIAVALYRAMSKVHRCDARVRKGLMTGEAGFSYWPVEGQEAMSAGAMLALGPDDQIVTTYRGLADVVAKGVSLPEYFAELLGKSTGLSKGKAGAMGVSEPGAGILWSTGIVGAGPPIANGLALAASLRNEPRVVLVSFGDGATSIGFVHEAMNLAAVWRLPVVFFCQNNAWAECTPIAGYTRTEHFADRAAGYGMPGVTVSGVDPVAVWQAVSDAATRARNGEGPTFVEAVAYRLQGHYFGDGMEYVDADELAQAREVDPFGRFRARVIDAELATEDELDQIDAALDEEIEAAWTFAKESSETDVAELRVDVFAGRDDESSRAIRPDAVDLPGGETEDLGLVQAINRTLDRAMAADDRVILLGEDIADPAGGLFKVTVGLSTKYGTDRVRATPIAETSIVGAALGAALGGLRPVAELMFMDFLGVALDQIANHAAKIRYMSGGRQHAPLVIRTAVGTGSGPQHSQALEAWAMHVPGLKVVWPSTPADAVGLLNACLDDEDPCIFIESMKLFFGGGQSAVPVADYVQPLGRADVKRSGSDATVVAFGPPVHDALAAAEALGDDGISVEVVDLRTLVPIDLDTVLESVARTGRLVVTHESVGFCGPGAEIAATVATELHGQLAAPVTRVAASFTPVPRSATLEAACRPGATALADAVRALA
jgi:2-oxoisovalerate dehydrogenase E1 component